MGGVCPLRQAVRESIALPHGVDYFLISRIFTLSASHSRTSFRDARRGVVSAECAVVIGTQAVSIIAAFVGLLDKILAVLSQLGSEPRGTQGLRG